MGEKIDVKNWSSKASAEYLAQIIEDYWGRQGFAVKTWVEPMDALEMKWVGREHTIYIIRSDMVGGLPKGWTTETNEIVQHACPHASDRVTSVSSRAQNASSPRSMSTVH